MTAAAITTRDRWYAALVWVLLCGWAADRSGLHFRVEAFLSGAVLDAEWFDQAEMDRFRQRRIHHRLVAADQGAHHVASTMLTVPMVAGRLRRARELIFRAA